MYALKLVERINEFVQRSRHVPCEVEAHVLSLLVLIDGFKVVVGCKFAKNILQFRILIDKALLLFMLSVDG